MKPSQFAPPLRLLALIGFCALVCAACHAHASSAGLRQPLLQVMPLFVAVVPSE